MAKGCSRTSLLSASRCVGEPTVHAVITLYLYSLHDLVLLEAHPSDVAAAVLDTAQAKSMPPKKDTSWKGPIPGNAKGSQKVVPIDDDDDHHDDDDVPNEWERADGDEHDDGNVLHQNYHHQNEKF